MRTLVPLGDGRVLAGWVDYENEMTHLSVVDVAAAAVEGDSGEMHRYWCCLGVSGRGGGVSTGGGDDDYLIMPAHTFAIWRLQ